MRVIVLATLLTLVWATHALPLHKRPQVKVSGPQNSQFSDGVLLTKHEVVIGFRQIVCEAACPSNWDAFNCTVTDFLIGQCVRSAIPDHFALIVGCEGPDAPPYYPTLVPQTTSTTDEPSTTTFVTDESTETHESTETSKPPFVPTVPPPEPSFVTNSTDFTSHQSSTAETTLTNVTTTSYPNSATTEETLSTEDTSSDHSSSSTQLPPPPPRNNYAANEVHFEDSWSEEGKARAPVPPHTVIRYVWNNSSNANLSTACAMGNQTGLVKEIVGECFSIANSGNILRFKNNDGWNDQRAFDGDADERILFTSDSEISDREANIDVVKVQMVKESVQRRRQERFAKDMARKAFRKKKLNLKDGEENFLYAINFCLRKGEGSHLV